MSMSVSIDTTKLNELIAQVPGNRDQVVRATAFHVLGIAVEKAPRRTGFLKSTGNVNAEYASSGFVNVEFTAEYAAYVELGTSRMAAQPYLKPAVEAEQQLFIERLKKGVVK